MSMNHRIVIAHLPTGAELSPSNVRTEESAVPECTPGTVLCKTVAVFVGSALRRVMGGYLNPGMVVMASGVARVLASGDPSYSEGDMVLAPTGWQSTLFSSRHISLRSFLQAMIL
jgi:NADPH-dependent curcumin reductase CurA